MSGYTVYWPRERWEASAGVSGDLPVLYGGPHQSPPSFMRAKVSPGDALYPIGFRDQALWLFARVVVSEIIGLGDYRPVNLAWSFLAGAGASEVVVCTGSAREPRGRMVPADVLRRLTYQPQRGGPRPVRFVTEDGRLTRSDSVQGVYRLSPESAADLDALLDLRDPSS